MRAWQEGADAHKRTGKKFRAYQRSRLALKMKAIYAKKATERMLAGRALDPVQKSAQGKTRDRLANLAGVSHDTVARESDRHFANVGKRC